MYEAFYGFKEKPFSMLPDPGFLYLSKKHQTALTLLEYGLLNHVGFCVVSGEPGAGKTTILRALLERVGDDVTVGLITNTHQSFGGLLDWVLSAFDLHQPDLTQVEMHQIFMEFLIEEYAKGRTTLLIVDEAQNMKPDALEELRMLTNVNTEKDQLMQVVLAGQPVLKETLRLPDLMQFAQRIAVDYHLDPLGLEETCGYIQHRLVTAGAQKDVFTPAACERIYNYSGGTPRLINLLCETVLVYGFADQQEMIDVELVDEMVLERMKDSVVPIVNRDIAHTDNKEASAALEKNFPWIRPQGDTAGLESKQDTISLAAAIDDTEQIRDEYIKPEIVGTVESEETVQKSPADTELPGAAAVESTADVEIEKLPEAEKASPVSAEAATTDDIVLSKSTRDTSAGLEDENETRKQLIKYGVIALAFAVVMIVFALALDVDDESETAKVVNDEAAEKALMQQRELEEQRFRQLQIEAETLKRERDAAIAKAEAEKQASLEAEKLAAEKAAIAAKAAEEKTRLEEKKRIEAAKQRELEAKKAAAKAKEAARRAKLEAEKLDEQRRIMQIRLEEERRLKEIEEARRLELERLEKQRLEILAAEESARQAAEAAAAAEAAEKAKPKSADCIGPTARFKSGCR